MKGHIPQGDSYSAFTSSSSQHSQVIPGLCWDSESQRRNSASSTRGRMGCIPALQPAEFNNSKGGGGGSGS